MKTVRELARGSTYLVVTDSATYWCRNFKRLADLTETLEAENIDFVYLMIVDKKFNKKKNTTKL